MTGRLLIVIPTLNEQAHIAAVLQTFLETAPPDAKIVVADGGSTHLDLGFVEDGLGIDVDGELLARAIEAAIGKIVQTAVDTVGEAGLEPEAIDAIYFTGGSTGIRALRSALSAAFSKADTVNGDPFASVARGLGVYAARLFSAG